MTGAQFGRNVPFSNFFLTPGGCGPGAWELKARWSNLTVTQLDSGQYNDFTFGFNWYWSDRVRTMFDWIHPVTRYGTTPYGPTCRPSTVIGHGAPVSVTVMHPCATTSSPPKVTSSAAAARRG